MGSWSPVRSLAWCAAYGAAVAVGRQLVTPETGLSLFWPAAGLAVLWLLPSASLRGRAVDLTLLWTSTFVLTWLVGAPVGVAAVLALANVVQPVAAVGVWHLLHGRLPGSLRTARPGTSRDLGALCLVGLAAACVGSPIGLLAALSRGAGPDPVILGEWVVRNGSGIVVLVAAVTAVRACAAGRGVGRLGSGQQNPLPELALAAAVSAVLLVSVFGVDRHAPIAFLTLAASAWFGLRFSPGVAGMHGLVQGAAVLVGTVAGRGPFGTIDDLGSRAVTVQLFVLTSVLMALALAVTSAERRVLLDSALASETRARERAQLLDAVTRDLDEGLVVVDRRGEVVLTNHAAHDLLGPGIVTTLGSAQPVPGLTRPDGSVPAAAERPTVRAMSGEVVLAEDLRLPAVGARPERTVTVSAAPVDPTGSSEDRLALTVVRDVTEERARVEELRAFAGVVAHDLKNPVAAVMSWTEILDDQLTDLGPDAAEARATLGRVLATSDRVQGLVDDLLVYAHAGAGDLRPVPVAVADLFDEALRQLLPTALAGADVALVEDDGGPVVVEVDPTLVRQLLVNLLGNSLKYVARGTAPVVRVTAHTDGDRVRVDVHDNGIGIPVAEQASVFEGFVRSSRTRSTFPGTGLGLAICARAVHRHGGEISAEDAGPEGGTRVRFTLPAANAAGRVAGLSARDASRSAGPC